MSRRPRSRFVARGDGSPYTPRHWNGQVAQTRANLPEPGMAVTATAAFLCVGLLLALILAGIGVCMVLAWPVH